MKVSTPQVLEKPLRTGNLHMRSVLLHYNEKDNQVKLLVLKAKGKLL